MAKTRKTVTIFESTYNRLMELGTMKDTHDSVINKLIDHYHNFTIKGGKKR